MKIMKWGLMMKFKPNDVFVLAAVFTAGFGVFTELRGQTDRFQPDIRSELVSLLEEARQERRSGNSDQAIESLQQIIKDQPDYYRAHFNLALAFVNQERYDESIQAFTKALEIKNSNKIADVTIYNSLGWTYLHAGDLEKAEEFLLLAVKNVEFLTDSSKKRVFNNIGWLYMYSGDYNAAEKYLKKAKDEYGSSLAVKNLALLEELLKKVKKLIDSSKSGDIKKIHSLLDRGADVNATDEDGKTALMEAADNNHDEIVDLIKSAEKKP